MNVTVMCSDRQHPAFPYLAAWCDRRHFRLVTKAAELESGDYLLLVSCAEIIQADVRARFGRVFVVHESNLPKGRGWSPLVWQIVEGKNDIPVTLLEAVDKVDAGAIWGQRVVHLEGHELADEIQRSVTLAKIDLLDEVVDHGGAGKEQEGEPTFYPKRTPADSRIDPHKTIAEQFDLLRVCEPRYPAYFDLRGHTYEITIRKRK